MVNRKHDRVYVLGASIADARSTCEALGMPYRCARTVRTTGGALRGHLVTRVLVTSAATAAMANPTAPRLTQQTSLNLTVIQRMGGQVGHL